MSDPRKIRIGLVGCGAISELYYAPLLSVLEQAGEIQVSSVFDPSSSRTAKLKELLPSAVPTGSFEEVLKLKPDLAIIASPPRFHARQAIELLEFGISAICEKPMAATVAEAEAMIEAAARTQKILAVGLFRRFFPVAQTIRELVQSQRLGAAKHFEISEGGPFNWPAQSASFFQKSGSQGGVLADLGVHVLDLLIWWFGMPEKLVYEDDAMGGLEANCRLELGFANGVSGTVRLSRDTQLPNRTIIHFEQGWVASKAGAADQLELGFHGISHVLSSHLVSAGDFRSQPAHTYHQSFASQLNNVLGTLRGTQKLLIPGEQGILSQRVIETAYRERQLMPMPWISAAEMERARKLC